MTRGLIAGWILFFYFALTLPVQAQYIKRDVAKVQAGMTFSEIKNAFGRPSEINTSGGPGGEIQQWVYIEGRDRYLYIYFEDGVYNGRYSRYGERPSRLP